VGNLSKHFSLRELTKSQTAERLGINNTPDAFAEAYLEMLCEEILEPVRAHYGIPFSPSSGYRSVELCEAIGSSAKSQHAKGQAADFEVPGIDNYDLATWIKDNLDFDQLILECYTSGQPKSGWVHCSIATSMDAQRNEVLTYNKSDGYKKGLLR
jgi:zinc D-Ala-D-Ala carboxypeptidase